jgi:hypothetical protein
MDGRDWAGDRLLGDDNFVSEICNDNEGRLAMSVSGRWGAADCDTASVLETGK